jgi:hypothetical protein
MITLSIAITFTCLFTSVVTCLLLTTDYLINCYYTCYYRFIHSWNSIEFHSLLIVYLWIIQRFTYYYYIISILLTTVQLIYCYTTCYYRLVHSSVPMELTHNILYRSIHSYLVIDCYLIYLILFFYFLL